MEMKINKIVLLKVIALLLCIYIAILPFYQPKKVQASPVLACAAVFAGFISGMAALGYIHYSSLTSEQMEDLNNKATANLKEAYPNAIDYDNQVNIIYNLENDLLSGKDIDWSKYSGKAIYAISKAVIDVLYPYDSLYKPTTEATTRTLGYCRQYRFDMIYGTEQRSVIANQCLSGFPGKKFLRDGKLNLYCPDATMFSFERYYALCESAGLPEESLALFGSIKVVDCANNYSVSVFLNSFYNKGTTGFPTIYISAAMPAEEQQAFIDFFTKVSKASYASITAKTANKVKLPTRLPPSVINNYNTYINGESENLIINPTDDELPQLPDNYNPVTDDPPDLDGYQDVTPDQEPTDTPDPTPSPTPEPTPSPDYDGSSWIKPIGDFFAGLLSFLKDALIPTQTVDFSPLQNMSTDFGSKFPFSLPGDIGKLFGVLQAEPRRPEFQMTFDLSKVGVPGDPIVWDLNFEQWDDAAAIVKTALYIGFLIGLVFISKNFMKN
ncbi:hypothetical protein [Eubacterium sp.]|uniref:hypothetical protein n=1 Tax=Eubacterium sp. TaxID=142586 RepID=UPI0026DF6251|nr:hypothetical protein [Eubacterium sp.]MDO5434611.1 hypothetical protein [Eubacterium sp.]